jgi:predicted ATP-binding protein involved in virulence
MKIWYLKLRNYKCFDNFEINFVDSYTDRAGQRQPINLHVLLAPNMVGKSAILKALRIALAARLQKIKVNAGTMQALSIGKEDHRVIGNNPFADIAEQVSITVKATSFEWSETASIWQESNFEWIKYKENSTKRAYTKLRFNQ